MSEKYRIKGVSWILSFRIWVELCLQVRHRWLMLLEYSLNIGETIETRLTTLVLRLFNNVTSLDFRSLRIFYYKSCLTFFQFLQFLPKGLIIINCTPSSNTVQVNLLLLRYINILTLRVLILTLFWHLSLFWVYYL